MPTMQSPDGRLGDVPDNRMAEALKQGFQLCVEMENPNSHAKSWVTHSLVDAHLKAGYTIVH